MMNAAAGIFLAARRNRKPTAKSYVQDGLISMWDGLENAGWGGHDASATTWQDLSGHGHDVPVNNSVFAWTQNSIKSLYTSSFRPLLSPSGVYSTGRGTIEAVFRISSVSGSFGRVWSNNVSNSIYRLALLVSKSTPSVAIQCGSINGSKFSETGIAAVDVGSIVCTSFYRDSTSNMGITVNGANYVLSGFSSVFNEQSGLCMFGDSVSVKGNNIFGDIYSVRSYSRALTADEIAANYAIDKARFNLPQGGNEWAKTRQKYLGGTRNDA